MRPNRLGQGASGRPVERPCRPSSRDSARHRTAPKIADRAASALLDRHHFSPATQIGSPPPPPGRCRGAPVGAPVVVGARAVSGSHPARIRWHGVPEQAEQEVRVDSTLPPDYNLSDQPGRGVLLNADLGSLCLPIHNEHGNKELVAVSDGYRESTASWREMLLDLRRRGLVVGPRLATADGALGFWKALREVYAGTGEQICWFHKSGNVLDKMPKSVQSQAKTMIREMWQAPSLEKAKGAYDQRRRPRPASLPLGPQPHRRVRQVFSASNANYSKAVDCLRKDEQSTVITSFAGTEAPERAPSSGVLRTNFIIAISITSCLLMQPRSLTSTISDTRMFCCTSPAGS